jgi:hypothetical protein
MNVYPFVEAEKAEQDGNVAMACVLLKVSRSAYYEWSKHIPSARDLSDAELGNLRSSTFTPRAGEPMGHPGSSPSWPKRASASGKSE